MATATIADSDSITTISGYAVFAEARTGSNGATDGAPEQIVGDSSANATGRVLWDSNLSDGFDSGWQEISLTVNPGGGSGGVTWKIGTQTVTYSSASYSSINSVVIRAAVKTAAFSGVRQVYVAFYKAGVLTDSYSLRSNPMVDDTGGDLPIEDQEVVSISPAANNNDKVVVTAQIRFASDSTDSPDVEDMFAQIFVYA